MGRLIPGPYKQGFREELLHEVLSAQQTVRKTGPEYVRQLELITLPELEEIRRIWVVDKHEIEDRLPSVYEKATGEQYPGRDINDGLSFGREEMELLQEICNGSRLEYEMAREILATEERNRSSLRRSAIFKQLQKAIERGFYDNEEDAVERAKSRDITWLNPHDA